MCSLKLSSIQLKIFLLFFVLPISFSNSYSLDINHNLGTYMGYPIAKCPKEFQGVKCIALNNFKFKSFKFEKSTFLNITNKFGNVPEIYKDENSHDQKICYKTTINSKIILIEFGSWDHGYKNLSVNTFEIKYDADKNSAYMPCGKANLGMEMITPESSLFLGITKKRFMQILSIKNITSGSMLKIQGGYVTEDLKTYINQSIRGYFNDDNILVELFYQIKSEPL